jgi:hypothetical protein
MTINRVVPILIGLILMLFSSIANASNIIWSLGDGLGANSINYWTTGPGNGDSSNTLGVDASINVVFLNGHNGTGTAGDNGPRNLEAYADAYYNGTASYYGELITSWADQWWTFSLDHASTIEGSFLLDGSFLKTGPDAIGGVNAIFDIYRLYGCGGSCMWKESIYTFNFSADQTQNISEQNSFTFNYDPSIIYGLSMRLNESAGYQSDAPSLQSSTVIADINTFQVNLTPVVPEPISSILFLAGGATLIVRIYLRRKKIEV